MAIVTGCMFAFKMSGSRTEEAFEAFSGTQIMDVGQIGWCFCSTTQHWSPQVEGIASNGGFPPQSSQVCLEQ